MFNKGLFNRLLFNRVISLFRDAEQIHLLGELLGFTYLEGLFQPVLSLLGVRHLTVEHYGNLSFSQNLDGSYTIFYNLEGELTIILEEGNATDVITLLGDAVDIIENGTETNVTLEGEKGEVNKDGEN